MSKAVAADTLRVCNSGCTFNDFQAALDAAQPGDTILLRAGETFVGHFVLPEKAAASGPAILIRSDAPDSALPPADTRLVPNGYAGGNTALGSLARLRGRGGQWKTTPVLKAAPRAHHYRLQFLDIDGIVQDGWYTLLELGTNTFEQATVDSTPYSIVFDRVYVHGHPTKGQQRCISMNGRDLEVRNSYVTNCSSFAVDSQAIGAFNAPGPLKIINNYLEAATENVMLGGADPRISGLVQSDVEIRRNHFFKPTAWRNPILQPPAAPSTSVIGGAGNLQPGTHYFKVVAVLEAGGDIALSAPSGEASVEVGQGNAAVVLNWGDVSGADRYRVYLGTWSGGQNRYIETSSSNTQLIYRADGEVWESPPSSGQKWNVKNLLELKNAQRVLIDGNVFEYLWPASQSGYAILFTPRNDEGGAPWSAVRDVTFSNNILRHASGGINILGQDYLQTSQRTERITIRNNLFYDLSFAWGGHAHGILVTGSPAGLTVDHNTIFHDGMVLLADSGVTSGFEFTNNVAPHNDWGFFGSGAGSGSGALSAYFPGAVFRRNALGGGPASQYPPDNLFPDMSTFRAQFVNQGADDYRLAAGSLFRGAGTDGKDLGVDFAALNAAQAATGSGSGPVTPDPGPGGGGGGGGGSTSPTAYTSTAVALPGTIQAENFDNGGASVGYADTTAGNSGGQYRSTDVDIEATNDAGGGYNVGWASGGEWLSYTVNVASTGTYDIDVRVASPVDGGTFHIEANDVNITGSLTVPNTGGWQTWMTVRRSGVTLAAGTQRWRLVLDTNGASGWVGNFNEIRVNTSSSGGSGGGGGGSTSPYTGISATLPGTLQAEDFDTGAEGSAYHDLSGANEGGAYRNTGVDVEATSDGGGHNVGWMFAGEWLKYTVNVTAGGTYDLEARVASRGGGGTFHVEIDGRDVSGPISIPDTGDWQTWSTVRKTGLTLAGGQQVWRLVMDTNGESTFVGNINFMRVVSAGAGSGGGGTPAGGDVVLYSSDVSTIAGNWTRIGSTSGAGGLKMQSADLGASNPDAPLASPGDYFEAQFIPEANRPYHVWLRLRASGETKFNDSVWVQFSGAVDSGGSPLWRSGTGSGLLVNLEACAGCGSSSWGWTDGAWWLDDTPIVTFPSTATQTIRIQTREDGLDIDQIVLSPATYFDRAPGAAVADTTIVGK